MPADAVTHLDEDRPLSLLLRWKPDLYVKGGDYQAASLANTLAIEASRVCRTPWSLSPAAR